LSSGAKNFLGVRIALQKTDIGIDVPRVVPLQTAASACPAPLSCSIGAKIPFSRGRWLWPEDLDVNQLRASFVVPVDEHRTQCHEGTTRLVPTTDQPAWPRGSAVSKHIHVQPVLALSAGVLPER